MEPGVLKLKGLAATSLYLFFEFFGTALLLFGIMMSGPTTTWLGAMYIFYGIMIGGRYTGGLFNGAVALGVYMMNLKNWKQNLYTLILTLIAQNLGAYVGITGAYALKGYD